MAQPINYWLDQVQNGVFLIVNPIDLYEFLRRSKKFSFNLDEVKPFYCAP